MLKRLLCVHIVSRLVLHSSCLLLKYLPAPLSHLHLYHIPSQFIPLRFDFPLHTLHPYHSTPSFSITQACICTHLSSLRQPCELGFILYAYDYESALWAPCAHTKPKELSWTRVVAVENLGEVEEIEVGA